MGLRLSNQNLPTPAVDGYVLKGNTDGTQFWAQGGSIIAAVLPVFGRSESDVSNISLTNFTFNVEDRSGSDVSINSMLVSQNSSSYEAPLQTFITSVS
jgi:hypothetical protein